MNKSELLDNIRADFFTEICPFFKPSKFCDYDAIQTTICSVRLINTFLDRDFFYRCATLVERNTIEYSLLNLYAKKHKYMTYKARINIRFASSFSASMFTAVVLKRSRNPFTVIVIPFFNGVISVTYLLLSNPDETDRFMRKNYPNGIKFLEEKCYLKEIIKGYKEINDFINRPHKLIHTNPFQ